MFVTIPEGSAFVVERLGRYHRTLTAGTHVILPILDRVRFRYSLLPREQEISETCVTRDNVVVRVTSTVRAVIADPQQAAYASANAGDSVVTLLRTYQRKWVGERSWNDVRESTRELESAVLRVASEPAEQMGVRILGLEVTSVERAFGLSDRRRPAG